MLNSKKLTSLFLSALFSAAVLAEADGPDFWQLRDVEKGHVLNMRSFADIDAPRIGGIPAGANCIRNMGCSGGLTYSEFATLSEAEKQQILKQRPRWCRIVFQGATAWVAGRYLAEGGCPENSPYRINSRTSVKSLDPLNHVYSLEKEKVELRNGNAHRSIPDSAAQVITSIVYALVYGQLDTGSHEDAAIILAQQTGGSGTFYYLAVATEKSEAIESYFLGDRIHIESLKIEGGTIIVDYLDRNQQQPMAEKPTQKRHKVFKLVEDKLIEKNL